MFPTQFDLFRGTIPRRKPSTEKQRLVFSHTINRTSDFDITYRSGALAGISSEVFANVDYSSKATDMRSVSGGAIMYGGACVCWFSRMQKCVTLFTSEAEYVALGDVVKELLLRQVWCFMIPGKGMPCFPVFGDNEGPL